MTHDDSFCDCEPSSYGSARPAPSSSSDNVSRTDKTFHVALSQITESAAKRYPQAQDPRKRADTRYPRAPHFGKHGTSLEDRHIAATSTISAADPTQSFAFYEQRPKFNHEIHLA
jgi:hypothetical protein